MDGDCGCEYGISVVDVYVLRLVVGVVTDTFFNGIATVVFTS